MSKHQPNFTGHSHEDMKRLLGAEDRRVQSVEDWQGFGMLLLGLAGAAVFVVAIGLFVIGLLP